jgi:cytoplasmic iron level regulating protein YaaA (DUF328/UPF0246 family)
MLLIISPAKTLNFDEHPYKLHSNPELLSESQKLIKILKKKKPVELMKLMDISEKLAVENAARFKNFSLPFTPENAKQAVLAFDGDVYDGLNATDFSEADFDFTQKHLRILSGLYGVLKPLDLMQPYRLEMGRALENPKGSNLYKFWGDKISLDNSLPFFKDIGDAAQIISYFKRFYIVFIKRRLGYKLRRAV